MPHRVHLFSLRLAHAFREACFQEHYGWERLRKDLSAGLAVGLIAIPLAMALAIASGVPPQHGLYTAAIAGFLIALTGGSRFSVSGPTAAFVVILLPITQAFGLAGLMIASMMAGVILIALAVFRLGRLIEYIPEAVTLGFTGGIAVVIATLQVKDFLGLGLALPADYLDKIALLAANLKDTHWPAFLVASATLAVMLAWPRVNRAVPPHLPALIVGTLIAVALNRSGHGVDTISSRFFYTAADGSLAHGIPSVLPQFVWPWHQPGAGGEAVSMGWHLIRELLPSAFAIAMLGAMESLLCALVLDGMTSRRHSANSELLGQGIGNLVAPLFGGVTATAALARSAANLRAGAQSPVAAMVHGLVVLLGVVGLAPVLGYLPMPAMAALLMVVAWNMSEAGKSLHLVKTSQPSDRWIFFTCLFLTIFFDMVIAVTAGILLATLLFMKEMAEMTKVVEITANKQYLEQPLPHSWRAFKVTGPLFFAAADKIFAELKLYCQQNTGVLVYLDNVNLLDAGGVSALLKLISHCEQNGACLVLTDLQPQPLKALAKANITPLENVYQIYPSLREAADFARKVAVAVPVS